MKLWQFHFLDSQWLVLDGTAEVWNKNQKSLTFLQVCEITELDKSKTHGDFIISHPSNAPPPQNMQAELLFLKPHGKLNGTLQPCIQPRWRASVWWAAFGVIGQISPTNACWFFSTFKTWIAPSETFYWVACGTFVNLPFLLERRLNACLMGLPVWDQDVSWRRRLFWKLLHNGMVPPQQQARSPSSLIVVFL